PAAGPTTPGPSPRTSASSTSRTAPWSPRSASSRSRRTCWPPRRTSISRRGTPAPESARCSRTSGRARAGSPPTATPRSSARRAALLGTKGGIEAVAQVLAIHPALPPGVTATIERTGERRAELRLAGARELLDPEAPGWLGLLASDEPLALEAIAQAVDPKAR